MSVEALAQTLGNSTCPAQHSFPTPILIKTGQEGVLAVQVIQPCHVAAIRFLFLTGLLPADLNTEVRFRATIRVKGTLEGAPITSDEFPFSIRVCMGCLQVGFDSPGFEDFDYPVLPVCDDLISNPYPGNPCNPAQDFGPILCCATSLSPDTIECPGRPRG